MLCVFDIVTWALAMLIAVTLRYEFELSRVNWRVFAGAAVVAALLQIGVGITLGLYRRGARFRTGSLEDTLAVSVAVLGVGMSVWIGTLIVGPSLRISRGAMLIAIPFALALMLTVRLGARVIVERSREPATSATPVLILGGGYIGTHLIHWMISDPESQYRPVGVLDDDPNKSRRRIRHVPVLGPISAVAEAAEATQAEILIVAIGEADAALLRRIQDLANQSGLAVKVMPPISSVVANGVRGGELRDLAVEDLLGRQPVQTNVSEIASYLTGKRVLVTGAGGSIGSQLCTEIAKYGPGELIMLDRDETGLQQALINTAGNGLLDTDAVVLADIRDSSTIMEIFQKRRPEVVFHAAALKHLPMLEQYPDEAWKTNVCGTLNVLEASRAAGVGTFVNISTDKAANPTSVLGHSKRVAEKLTGWFGAETQKTYLSVRFGNVIGSRGSMLPTFMRLIEEDKPLTVTHPDVTRFFMTIPEACQLVLQAGGIGRPGEVLILDMGEPVSILEIAKRMIAMSGKQIEIVFTGLREGEKMHEDLVGASEDAERPFNSRISHAHVDTIAPAHLDRDGFMARLGKVVTS